MTEIFIENKRLDISEDLSNLLTFSIDDITDIGSRNTAFSKTIVLPGTANNNRIFGHTFDVSVSNWYNPAQKNVGINFNPSEQANCIVFQNHLQVFKGILRILQINIVDNVPEYECAIFGELGGLANSLGTARLQDLDFSAYDHILSVPNVSGSWNNINGSGFFYPLADYGKVSTNKVDYDIRAFRPALYVKEYIDKIFSNAGYTYECDLFNTPRFKGLVIPHNQKELTKNESEWIIASRINIGDYDIIDSAGITTAKYSFTGVELLNFTGSPGSPDYDSFTYTGPNGMTARAKFRIIGDYRLYSGEIAWQLRENGAALLEGSFSDTAGIVTPFEISGEADITLASSNVYDILFIGSAGAGNFNVGSAEGNFSIKVYTPQIVPVGNGDTLRINDTIPKNILQKEFLSSIIRLFNLYVYEDRLSSKKLLISPYVDFYNSSGVVDWTYKMDRYRKRSLKPMSELNERFYDFKFKQDSDYYNELYAKRYGQNYGDYLFDSQFAFSGDKKEIPLIFSGTPLVGYSGVDKIVPAYYKLDSSNEEQPVDFNIRILQAKRISGVSSWSILDDVIILQTGLTAYGYAGHYDDPDAPANDIHFGVPRELFFTLVSGAINVHQFNVYWSAYMAEITDKDSKLLTAWFKLNSKDIYDLDFSKFIYIDGTYYRLNKIIDWNASDPDVCQCELLKVNYTQY